MDNKKITEERINETLNNAFVKANENIAINFVDNVKLYEDALSDFKGIQGYEMYFAAMKTAINSSFVTIKEALKELLCD